MVTEGQGPRVKCWETSFEGRGLLKSRKDALMYDRSQNKMEKLTKTRFVWGGKQNKNDIKCGKCK